MRQLLGLLIVGPALALSGCVIPGTNRAAVEPASVTAPPSLEHEIAQHAETRDEIAPGKVEPQ
jgi:hypothetical protein